MNVSRWVDYRSIQVCYSTPSHQKVTVVQRRQQNPKFREIPALLHCVPLLNAHLDCRKQQNPCQTFCARLISKLRHFQTLLFGNNNGYKLFNVQLFYFFYFFIFSSLSEFIRCYPHTHWVPKGGYSSERILFWRWGQVEITEKISLKNRFRKK